MDQPDYAFLRDTLKQFSRLKAHLTLPEPGNTIFVSPTHFNNATAGGSANDQWSWDHRDFAAAMVTDDAKYLAVGGRSGRVLKVPDEATMRKDIAAGTAVLNRALAMPIAPGAAGTGTWEEQHWSTGWNYAAAHYRPGFYDAMKKLQDAGSQTLRPPWLRDGDFIEQFDRDFVVAKFGSGNAAWGAIVHTGRLATGYPTATLPFGFGGGALSAFWTPAAGPALLGVQGGSQSPHPNRWDECRGWVTHAVTGEAANGKPFSSARLLNPTVEVSADANRSVDIKTGGRLGSSIDGGTTAPDGALAGLIDYQRLFHIDAKGLAIETRVAPIGPPDSLHSLYETLPAFYDGEQMPVITLVVEGARMAPRTQVIRKVSAIEIARKGGVVRVDFQTPQGVLISPFEWSIDYQLKQRGRALLIDLLDSGGQTAPVPTRTLRYTIRKG